LYLTTCIYTHIPLFSKHVFVNRTETVEYLEESPYGYTYGVPIWLDELSCTGDEESVEDCVHDSWGKTDCTVSEHVAVHCFGTPSGKN
jgi:hypothetical protein